MVDNRVVYLFAVFRANEMCETVARLQIDMRNDFIKVVSMCVYAPVIIQY
jgi:hypothetical protein